MEHDQLYKQRHSLSHLLAMAVLELFPEAKLAIGPSIDTGFYYDFDLPRSVTAEELKSIQKRMRSLIASDLTFEYSSHSIDQSLVDFESQPYKYELISDLKAKGEQEVSCYTSGTFTDLCKGPHVTGTKEIPADSFEISHVAGAYWRGDEKRPMLQRIYGLAFESKAKLDEYKQMIEEAKKRDHRKLGVELDLFTFSELVGPGLPLWTPKGNTLRLLLDEFVWSLRKGYGFERVEIPHITKKDLYIKSGHWEKYSDDLFKIKTREGHEFAMKPMNCPHHTQIFDRKKWSYRDMPQRYSNTTTCYRDEQTGELNGLSRVRALAQDDAHVFCRYSQAKEELLNVWTIIEQFYSVFGFDLRVRLSTHDPENMQTYLGDLENWTQTEQQLKELIDEKGVPYELGVGEAAFYGPKIDFMGKDSIGREWQVATMQLDVNMPNRFELSYTGEDGSEEPVLMIHCAIMGSLERFLSIIIEHLAGNFPFWLAPVQIAVLSVSDGFNQYTEQVGRELSEAGFRVETDTSSESVGKKIRTASLQKIPAKIVIGQQEVDALNAGEWKLKLNWRADLAVQNSELQSFTELIHNLSELEKSKK